MKYFSRLKIKDILSLIGLVIIGFAWVMIDQIFIKQSGYRFIVFSLIMVILFYVHYLINKPQMIWYYANSIALILLIFVILSSVIMHVLIYHDFADKYKHSVLIWIITGLMPYFIGLIYIRTIKK